MTMLYLAEACDQADPAKWPTAPAALTEEATRYGHVVYRPRAAWKVGKTLHRVLDEVNRAALDRADVMAAYLPKGTASIGVPMEIEYAIQNGIPVHVFHDGDSFSLHGRATGVHDSTSEWIDATMLTLGAIRGELDRAMERNEREIAGLLPPLDEPEPTIPLGGGVQVPAADLPNGVVKFVLDQQDAKLPARSHPDDAGLDIFVKGFHKIPPGQYRLLPSGIAGSQLPDGFWGLVAPRSSTIAQRSLHVPLGVIDPGWRGPLLTGVWNLSEETVEVADKERLAQLILVPLAISPPVQVLTVDRHDRGHSGFGSTGR